MDVDALQTSGLEVSRWFQLNLASLDRFLAFISRLGAFELYLVIVLIIYWCINKRRGKELGMLLAGSFVAIAMLKHIFRLPRPFWLDQTLLLGISDSYGFPSGHVTIAAVTYTYLAIWFKDRFGYMLAATLIILMGVSRIYLGVHFWYDTLAGLLLAGLILAGFVVWKFFLNDSFEQRILGQRFWFVVTLGAGVATLYGLVLGGIELFGSVNQYGINPSFFEIAERESWITSASGFAVLLGLGCGFALEDSWIRFKVDGSVWRRAYRFLLGLLFVLFVLLGVDIIIDQLIGEEPIIWLEVGFNFLHLLLVSISSVYIAPRLFRLSRLVDYDVLDKPVISLRQQNRPPAP